jgi:hypothetical protein
MNRFFIAALMATAMIVSAPMAHAADDDRFAPRQVSSLIDRVHQDLNHAYSVWHFSDADRDRLNNAEKQLREFSQKWNNAKFDKGELDDAIAAIQHVLDNNKLPSESRDALSDDVARLREMREAYDRHQL